MNGFKALATSKTFWSAVLALAGIIASVLFDLDEEAVASLVSRILSALFVSGTVYGRTVATQRIGSIMPPRNSGRWLP